MEDEHNDYNSPSSFYDKYAQEDENIQAKVKPILNELYENRVMVKELHTQIAVRFSEIIISYRTRLNELKNDCEAMIFELHERENSISKEINELLEENNPK